MQAQTLLASCTPSVVGSTRQAEMRMLPVRPTLFTSSVSLLLSICLFFAFSLVYLTDGVQLFTDKQLDSQPGILASIDAVFISAGRLSFPVTAFSAFRERHARVPYFISSDISFLLFSATRCTSSKCILEVCVGRTAFFLVTPILCTSALMRACPQPNRK